MDSLNLFTFEGFTFEIAIYLKGLRRFSYHLNSSGAMIITGPGFRHIKSKWNKCFENGKLRTWESSKTKEIERFQMNRPCNWRKTSTKQTIQRIQMCLLWVPSCELRFVCFWLLAVLFHFQGLLWLWRLHAMFNWTFWMLNMLSNWLISVKTWRYDFVENIQQGTGSVICMLYG